jgi:hypothetical protein
LRWFYVIEAQKLAHPLVTTKQHSSSAEHRQQQQFDAEIAIALVKVNLESFGELL